jgi:hypothetical protein
VRQAAVVVVLVDQEVVGAAVREHGAAGAAGAVDRIVVADQRNSLELVGVVVIGILRVASRPVVRHRTS